jgi:hypothetical protein
VQAIEQPNASLDPQDQIPTGAAVPNKTVGGKTFLATPGGLKAAEDYRADGNTEEGRVKRKAEAIRQLRGSEAAQKFMTDWATNQEALHKAQINAVKRVGLEKIAAEDYTGLADLYSKYNDGQEVVFEPGQAGGGTFAIYQGDPKDGKRVGAIGFKDKDEAAQKFLNLMDPVEAMKRRAAAEAEAAKPQKLGPGDAVFENGVLKYQSPNESPTVVAARIRAESGGGTGGKPVMPKMTKNEQGELMDEYTGATLKVIPGTPEERPWFGKVKPATPARKVWVDANDNPIPGGLNALYPQLPAADGARPQDAAPKAPANSWNDATGEVISNGKVIGKAKTKEEARALLSKQPKPEPAKPASPMSARPGDADMAMILRNELKQAVQRLEIAKANRDPQAGPRAQQDIEALLREMKRNNISVS